MERGSVRSSTARVEVVLMREVRGGLLEALVVDVSAGSFGGCMLASTLDVLLRGAMVASKGSVVV